MCDVAFVKVLLSELSSAATPAHHGVTYTLPTTFSGSSTYLGGGLHRVTYNATARGLYNLTVLALSRSKGLGASQGFEGDGRPIKGSPFHPYVAPAAPSATKSNIWGHGLRNQV